MSSNLEKFYIPRFLDEPFRLIFWTADECLFLFAPMALGIYFGYIIIGIVLGIISFLGWKRIKKDNQSGRLQCLVYWYFPSSIFRLQATPASYRRVFRR